MLATLINDTENSIFSRMASFFDNVYVVQYFMKIYPVTSKEDVSIFSFKIMVANDLGNTNSKSVSKFTRIGVSRVFVVFIFMFFM